MFIAYIIVSIILIICCIITIISSFSSHKKKGYNDIDDEFETMLLGLPFCEKCGCRVFPETEKCPNCGEKIKD